MFNKKPDRPALPNGGPPPLSTARPPAAPRRATGAASVIGADLTITGNLETAGEVQINGEVQGDINAGRIVVGEQAMITGELTAAEIVIGGNVQGTIRGNNVVFQSASRVEGDVFHRSLAIEQGAYFEGKSRRTDDPMSMGRTPHVMVTPT